MNSESLEALVLDRSFGELSPEAEELLAAYLELHPEAMREVEKIEASLSITKAAVTARSDLFSERLFSEEVREQEAAGADRSSKILPLPSFRREALRAVAAVVVVMGVAVAGYMVGNYDAERVAIGPLGGGVSGEGIALGAPAQSVGNAAPMPWAQYRLTASGLETVIANAPVGH